MSMFLPDTGFPAPGRTQLTLDEAEAALVDASEFAESDSRRALWANLETYLARFALLEEKHENLMAGRSLLYALWIGGSFVSVKPSPKNIDMSVLVNADAAADLKGREGAGWLSNAFRRDKILTELNLSVLKISYRRVESPFHMLVLTDEELTYYRDRGAWDDWWQRCRTPGVEDRGITPETMQPRRGYVEVIL